MKNTLLISLSLLLTIPLLAQPADRWQQRAEYKMDIDFDVENHQFKGSQSISYYNNSPDTLTRVFRYGGYHS